MALEVYLHTSYSPDCEWIDGELKERNLGQFDHVNLQGVLAVYLSSNAKMWDVRALPEQRLKVNQYRYRVPDIVVIARQNEKEQTITIAPLLCIEILSPDDTVSDYQERLMDYLAMGVKAVWILDPTKQRAWQVTGQGSWVREPKLLTCGVIEVDVVEIFRLASE